MTETYGAGPSSTSLYEMARREFGRAHLDTARALLDAFLEGSPDHAEAWRLLADTHLNENREVAAIACLRRALAVEPDHIQTLRDLSVLYLEMGRFAEAVEAVRGAQCVGAFRSRPDLSLGGCLCPQSPGGRGACRVFPPFSRIRTIHASAAFETAMILLGRGDYPAGWPHFERRHDLDPHHRVPVGPAAWTGSAPAGQQLLVTPEGGFGDMIWAARFSAGRTGAWCQRNADGAPGTRKTCFPTSKAPTDWYWMPMIWAPTWICGVPFCRYRRGSASPILRRSRRRGFTVDPCRKTAWKNYWHAAPAENAWGSCGRAASPTATIATEPPWLKIFLPLMELPSVQLYALQKGTPQGDLADSGVGHLIIETDDFDFAETAALVDSLDLIIMTDSALAHIAGSLNKPVWVLLDANPYW